MFNIINKIKNHPYIKYKGISYVDPYKNDLDVLDRIVYSKNSSDFHNQPNFITNLKRQFVLSSLDSDRFNFNVKNLDGKVYNTLMRLNDEHPNYVLNGTTVLKACNLTSKNLTDIDIYSNDDIRTDNIHTLRKIKHSSDYDYPIKTVIYNGIYLDISKIIFISSNANIYTDDESGIQYIDPLNILESKYVREYPRDIKDIIEMNDILFTS